MSRRSEGCRVVCVGRLLKSPATRAFRENTVGKIGVRVMLIVLLLLLTMTIVKMMTKNDGYYVMILQLS